MKHNTVYNRTQQTISLFAGPRPGSLLSAPLPRRPRLSCPFGIHPALLFPPAAPSQFVQPSPLTASQYLFPPSLTPPSLTPTPFLLPSSFSSPSSLAPPCLVRRISPPRFLNKRRRPGRGRGIRPEVARISVGARVRALLGHVVAFARDGRIVAGGVAGGAVAVARAAGVAGGAVAVAPAGGCAVVGGGAVGAGAVA
ncbi:hypothetical protein EDC01DRAFT_285440 [Geopyxis carbonaria]|nr:hypothetical protein EDC01DRAFT_285440 [Geopyxis carbonaria]